MSRISVAFVGVLLILAGLPPTAAASGTGADCQFVLGFRMLHDLIPSVVGDCLTDEQHGTNGDGRQRTTGGLLVWRKADNFTAFTDGFRTWINGPFGLQERLNTERFDWEKGATVSATEVIRFVPPATTAQQASGSCFTSSIAATRPDAFRCMAGNVIFDPCFTTPATMSAVICVRNPLDPSTFTTLNLTQPLPAPESTPAQTHPWFLQLADQTICNFFTGATGLVNGERLTYGCSDGWSIVGDLQHDTVWTATEVLLAPRSFNVQKTARVQIAMVWE